MPETIDLSVVLPVFNEQAVLPELHRRLWAALEPLGLRFQVVYVDDGSTDGSLAWLLQRAAAEPSVAVVALSRNFGHQVALTAGLDHAGGEAVVLMDSDLQDPPELIAEMVAAWRRGAEVVHARRRGRPGESPTKRLTAYAFYRFMRVVGDVRVPYDAGDFRLLSRPAAQALRSLRERRRFLRGLVSWTGFRQDTVLYDRPPRGAGESKYSVRDMARLTADAVFGFSSLPVNLLGLTGATVCAAAALGAAVGKVAALWAALLFLGGAQLVGLWILGRYLLIVADEARARPLYVVRETANL